MNNKRRKINLSTSIIISLIIGGFLFLVLYGYIILNPFYVDWIKFGSSDLQQHYYGWLFFKDAAWSFPLGLFNSLSFPNKISIIFTDSIPIIAIAFKFLLKLFNYQGEFQYFGLYGLICFMLQSLFGALIARKFIKSYLNSFLFGILFCIMPIFLYREFIHCALASHWIILFSISILVWGDYISRKKFLNQLALISLIALLCAGVHIYFIPLCFFFVIGYSILYLYRKIIILKNRNIKTYIRNSFLIIFSFIITGLSVVYLEGGFSSNVNYFESKIFNSDYQTILKFKQYYIEKSQNADILTLIKPGNMSRIINVSQAKIPIERFGYLGFGVCILFFVSIFFYNPRIIKKQEKLIFYILLLNLILSYLLSLIPIIKFNDKVVYILNLDNLSLIKIFYEIFRANGRFIFITNYAILTLSILFIGNKKKLAIVLVILSIFFQLYDLSNNLLKKPQEYKIKKKYTKQYEELLNLNLENHLFILHNSMNKFLRYEKEDRKECMKFVDFAYRNKIKLTNFYFARELIGKDYLNKQTNLLKHSDIVVSDIKYDRILPDCSKVIKFNKFYFCEIK